MHLGGGDAAPVDLEHGSRGGDEGPIGSGEDDAVSCEDSPVKSPVARMLDGVLRVGPNPILEVELGVADLAARAAGARPSLEWV